MPAEAGKNCPCVSPRVRLTPAATYERLPPNSGGHLQLAPKPVCRPRA